MDIKLRHEVNVDPEGRLVVKVSLESAELSELESTFPPIVLTPEQSMYLATGVVLAQKGDAAEEHEA